MRSSRLVGAALLVLGANGLAACGSSGGTHLSETSKLAAAGAPQQLDTSNSVILPAGFSKPAHIAGDLQGGVWFLSESRNDARVFHATSGTSSLQSWSLGDPNTEHLVTGIENAIAVGPNGHVWIGVGSTLVDFNPTKGSATRIALAAPADSAAAETERPTILQGDHAINSLAVSRNNHVAVSRDAAAEVQIIDGSNDSLLAPISLPPDSSPVSVSFSADGAALAVGLWVSSDRSESKVLLETLASGSSQVVDIPGHIVRQWGEGYLVGRQEDGSLFSLQRDGQHTAVSVRGTQFPLVVGGQVAAAGTYVALETVNGIAVEDTATGKLYEFQLPAFDCSGASFGGTPNGSVPSGSASCAQHPLDLAIDAAGDIWYIPSGPANMVGYINHSQY